MQHKESKDHKCEEYDKYFGLKKYLMRHIDPVYLNLKNHQCQECGKSFGEKLDLMQHIDTVHLELGEHICEVTDAKCVVNFLDNWLIL
ncbi:zinc finger protein 80-like isoform X2 [Trichogramma pretiosum]|uniref:zinc finger protein 80-like isoform X2 n=1 Tax=Trichogramma pretiosum TaxID=7493 RepID=UPI000C719B94|nr:zinc finger protein 80-like isoform X2 [Trichogramma pretiosum]